MTHARKTFDRFSLKRKLIERNEMATFSQGLDRGRGGGGQMVSVLTFNSDDPSLNAAESLVFK